MRFFLSQIAGTCARRRLATWVMAFALVVGIFGALISAQKIAQGSHHFGIQTALAEDCGGPRQPPCPPKAPPAGIASLLSSEAGGVISLLVTMLFKLMAGLLWFVLFWMGDLMDNTFILEGNIGEKLHSVWVIVRNFVNIFFAIVLVVVAFLAVIGYGDESGNYGLKKFIPKMAMALIAVNFTFLACRLVLDVNNVLTTAIFAIPQNVTNLSDITPSAVGATKSFRKFECLSSSNKVAELELRSKVLETRYPGVINSLGGVCYANEPIFEGCPDVDKVKANNPGGLLTFSSDPNHPIADCGGQAIVLMGSSQFSKKDFVWTMATQFQGLHNLNRASQLLTPDFTNLTVSALFSIIFAVIYGTAYVAMFIVLIGRMVVLWVTIMLSPLAAVSIVVPDLLPEDLNIQKKFLSHAFVPLKMSIPLSFGYILISQMSLVINTNTNIVSAGSLDLTGGGEFARNVSISTLLYGAASVAIIWMGVFMASKDVVGSGLVETIKGKVESAGNTVAKWPTYLPMFPFGSSHFSLASLGHAFQAASAQITEDQRKRTEADAGSLLAPFGFIIGDLQKASASLLQMTGPSGHMNSMTFKSDIRTVAEKDDSSKTKGREVIKSIVTNKDKLREHGGLIASTFGVDNFEQFLEHAKDPKKVEQMLDHVKSASTSAALPAVSYSGITFGDEKIKVKTDKSSQLGEKAKEMGLVDKDGKKLHDEFTIHEKGSESVMNWLKSLTPEQFEALDLDSLQQAFNGKEFLAQASQDTALKQKIYSLFKKGDASETKTHNSEILKLYTLLFATKRGVDGTPENVGEFKDQFEKKELKFS